MAAARTSITLRLTVFFATASTLVLLVLGFLVARSVEMHFVELDMEILSEKLDLARQKLGNATTEAASTAIPQQLDDALAGQKGLAVAIRLAGGQTLFAANDADFPQALFDRRPAGDAARPIDWVSTRGVPYRGIAMQVNTGMAEKPALVAVATDTSHHAHFMRSFRHTLWGFVVLAALLTGFLGWLAVRRGLSPLQAIRQKAESITAQKLDARVPLDKLPEELAPLVETLNAMLSRLEDSFRRLSDFSSDLAHELRTPVSNLLTQTQVTLSRARSAEEYCEVLASNVEEFERLSAMISDMLFIAKADDGRFVPSHEAMSLAALADDVIDFYRLLADEKALSIERTGEAELAGDRPMVSRAIGNLLSNAIRHADAGSVITVSIESPARVTVSNRGETIAPSHLPRLFDRFYRADPSRQTNTSGVHSGLGLAIVKAIVKAHGGDVVVRSVDGLTTFVLEFPRID